MPATLGTATRGAAAAAAACARCCRLNAGRRDALLLALTAAWPTARPAAAAAAPDFYASWPYATPNDIIPFVRQRAAPGDAQAVLDAMDEHGLYYP